PPLEHIARDPHRAGDEALLGPLDLRADVDEDGAALPRRRQRLGGGEPPQPRARLREQLADRQPVAHRHRGYRGVASRSRGTSSAGAGRAMRKPWTAWQPSAATFWSWLALSIP